MGLIYNPSDSHGLVSALNANIRTADEMVESLNRASKYLIDALGNNSLSGAAYTAGKFVLSINSNKDFQRIKELARSGGLPKDIAKDVLSAETVGKVSKEIGIFYRGKGIRLGSYSDSEVSLSRLANRGSQLKSVGDDFIEASEVIGRSKVLKVAGAAGTILSIGLDYDEQMSKYHDQGRAIKNTVAHAALSSGGAAIGAAIGTAIPIPVVGTLVGAAAGAAIGAGLSAGYDWIESGKASKDIANFKKSASKTVNNLKNEAGKVFSGWGKSLGGAFS